MKCSFACAVTKLRVTASQVAPRPTGIGVALGIEGATSCDLSAGTALNDELPSGAG